MKTNLCKNWVAGSMAAMVCLAGGTSCVTNAQDQPPPPPTGVATSDDSTVLPPDIDPASPLAQVVKLTQAGVSEDIILGYVSNSGSTFNLDPDRIIYLKDIGVPDSIVTAMMQRDQALQAQMAASTYQPPPVQNTMVVDAAPPPVVTVDYFYTTLAPYGTWVDVQGYGRCWRPTVFVGNPGWQPYCDNGHWVYTDDGWYWISSYSWGWAPFHYGRWFRDARLGWCWYPDTVWGPSWVTWRYGDDYCGWAPLPPRCVYREGAGFFYNGVSVGINFDFGLNVGLFTFVHTRDFCDPHPWRHRVESREVTQVFNHTTIINNFDVDREHRTFINHGIDPQHITEVTHTPIRPIAIRDTTTRVPRGEQLGRDGRTLMVNRPQFTDNPSRSDRGTSQHNPSPSPVVGSPNQPPRGNDNNNSQRPRGNQPTQPSPLVGSPYQPSHNGNGNNNSQPPAHNQPTQPVSPPNNRYTPIAPVQPSTPNNNSPDNRRYPSPRMQQQPGQQNPRVGAPVIPQAPANPHQVNRSSPPQQPPQPPQRNYNPPVAQPPPRTYTPPVVQPAPSQPEPRYEAPQNNSRPDNSQPQAQGNQSHGGSAPVGQSQGQGNGRGRNQNGQ